MSLSDTRARTTRCCVGPSQKTTHLQYTTVSGGSLSRQIGANDGAKASTMSTDVLPKRTWMRARLRATYTRNGSNPMLLPVRRRSRAIARRLQLLSSSSFTGSRACSTLTAQATCGTVSPIAWAAGPSFAGSNLTPRGSHGLPSVEPDGDLRGVHCAMSSLPVEITCARMHCAGGLPGGGNGGARAPAQSVSGR